MFKYCPSCASSKITFKDGKLFTCPDCGFYYYHNNAAATGCIIYEPEKKEIVFLVRKNDPQAGKLDFPGGFVDAGEGALEGLCRELKEELDWTPPEPPVFFASFSNVYKYKGIDYNTCDLYFYVSVPGLKPSDFKPEKDEVSGVRFIKPEDIDYSEIAFEPMKKAINVFISKAFLSCQESRN